MSEPAVIKATFGEWRMVKGRKVLQLVFEVPLEQQQTVLETLGAPMPDVETWVAIARLRQEPVAETKSGTSLTQIAGILCNEGAFNAWARENSYADGKAYIYDRCGVKSRRELDTDAEAGQRFRDMRADYLVWRDGAAA